MGCQSHRSSRGFGMAQGKSSGGSSSKTLGLCSAACKEGEGPHTLRQGKNRVVQLEVVHRAVAGGRLGTGSTGSPAIQSAVLDAPALPGGTFPASQTAARPGSRQTARPGGRGARADRGRSCKPIQSVATMQRARHAAWCRREGGKAIMLLPSSCQRAEELVASCLRHIFVQPKQRPGM